VQATAVDQAEPRPRLAPEVEVLGDAHLGHQVELLVDGGHAGRLRLRGLVERHRLAADRDLALVVLEDAREDVDEGRLAGAVLAQQRVHLAVRQLEVHAA
jgi:hypothetical protein